MKIVTHICKSVVVLFSIVTLFACEGNYKKVQKMSLSDNAPVGIGINTNTKYTDSGRITFNLITPKSLDYTTLEFPYREFPEGIEVYSWKENGEKSVVTSDYAISYEKSGIVDLRKNVVITTSDGNVLYADQLYWDQKNKWIFTDQPYKMKFKDGSFNDGASLDSSEDFKTIMSRSNQGVQLIDKKTQEEI